MLRSHLVPHYVILGSFLSFTLIGVITNSGVAGIIFAKLIALGLDPMVLVVAVLVGILTRRHLVLLVSLVAISVLTEYVVTQNRLKIGLEPTWETVLPYRIASALLYGYLVNLVSEWVRIRRTRAEGDRAGVPDS